MQATPSELLARGRAQEAVRVKIAPVHGRQRLVVDGGILLSGTRHYDELVLATRAALLFLLLAFLAQQL